MIKISKHLQVFAKNHILRTSLLYVKFKILTGRCRTQHTNRCVTQPDPLRGDLTSSVASLTGPRRGTVKARLHNAAYIASVNLKP
jgi:hypothetical protein